MGVTEGKIRDTGEGSGSGTSGSSRTRRTTHGVARGMTSDNVTTTMHSGHRLARLRLKPGSAPIHSIHHTSNTTEGEEDTTSRSSPIPVNNSVSSGVNSVSWQKNKKNKHCDTETHSARPALTSIAGGDSSNSSSTRSQPMRLFSRSRGTTTVSERSTTHTSGPIVRVVSPNGSRTTAGITTTTTATTATTPGYRGRRSVPKHQVPELRQTVFTSLLVQSGFVDTTPSDLTALTSPPIPITSTLLMSAGAGDSASNHSMSSVAESHLYMLSSTSSSQEPHTTHALPMLMGSTREGMTLGANEQLPPPPPPYLSSTYSGHVSHANSSTTSVQVPPTRTLAPTLITTNTTTTTTTTSNTTTTTTPAPPQLPGAVLAVTSPTALAQSPQECCTMSLLIPSNNLAGMSFSEVSLSNHGNSTGSAYVPLIQSSIAMGNGAGGGSLQQIASHAGSSLVRGPTLPSSVPNSTKPHLAQHNARHPMHDTSGITTTATSSWARLQTVPSSPVQPDRGVSAFASSHTAPASASLTLSNATTAVLGTGVGLTDVPYWGRHATQQQPQPQQQQVQLPQQQQPRSTSMLGTFSQMSITDVELSASFTIYLKKTVEFARAMVREGLPFHFDHQRNVMQLYDLLGLDTDNEEEEEAERHKVEDDEKDDVVDTAEKAVGTTYEAAMALHMASSVLLAEQDMTAYQRRLRRYRFPPPEMSQLREDTAEAAKLREAVAVHMLGRRELARRQCEEQKRQRRNEQEKSRRQQQQQQKGVQRCESIASSTSGSRASVRKVDTPASRGHAQPQSSLILSHGDGYQLTSNMGSTTTTTTGSSGSTSSAGTQCSALGPGELREQREVQPSPSLRQEEETNEAAIATTNATTVTTRKERGTGRIAPRHRGHVHHHIHDFLLPLRGNETGYTCMDEVHAHRRVVLARAAFLDSDEDDEDEAESAEVNAGEQAASAQGV